MEDKIVLPEEPQTDETQQTENIQEPVQETEASSVEQPIEEASESKGANQRIKELVQEKKAAQEEVKSLSQRLAEITQPVLPQQQPYVPQVQPGQELTVEQYQTDIAKTADAKIELRLAQERAVNRVNSEAQDAMRKYPQLDPASDMFDSELSEAVSEATDAAVRVNPYSVSVLKVVDKFMKPYQKVATREASKATQTIVKQVSDAAMRPTSVRQPEKPASEKSIQELERELGITQA